MLVGSEEGLITSISGSQVLQTIEETGPVVDLCRIEGRKNAFGYALANGVTGVYAGQHRVWKIKVRPTWDIPLRILDE